MSFRFLGFLLWLGASCAARAQPALAEKSHADVYVWQRNWSPEVNEALRAARDDFDGFAVLAAEVAWINGTPRIWRATPDWRALREVGRPVALVLRVGPWPGPFAEGSTQLSSLIALARDCTAQAKQSGITPAEIQIDFDCAEAKLAGYQTWLKAIRAAVRPLPLVFTALPVWLKHDEFQSLAHTVDGFILQVHSLDRPTRPDAAFTLCDPTRAENWVRQASAVGVPFRVALPTYGYDVGFTATGKFLGLEAEAVREWPRGTVIRTVESNPKELSQLAQHWARYRPAHYTGVIWFRLPAAGDENNWPWETLHAVLVGTPPHELLTTEVRWTEPGLAEVSLVNRGETRVRAYPRIALSWTEAPLAADGLGGYRVDRETLQPAATTSGLAPGQRRQIAWLRFSHATTFTATLIPPLPTP